MLEIKNAVCGYGSRVVLEGLSLAIEPGEIVCILGANGVGKTTLFKSILGHLKLLEGEILLEGEDINKMPRKWVAQKIGYVPQAHTPPFPFSVIDVVAMGRTAHLSLFAAPSATDMQIAKEALQTLGIGHLQEKIYTQISGGERQLVLISRALAQQPKMLIMDEPTANLDFGNQIKTLDRIRQLALSGLSVVYTTHYPDHAFLCSTKVAVIRGKDQLDFGPASDIITSALLKEIYGVDVDVKEVESSSGKVIVCIPC